MDFETEPVRLRLPAREFSQPVRATKVVAIFFAHEWIRIFPPGDHFINSITSSIEFRKKWIDFWAHRKMSKFLMWRKILFLKFSPDFEETWNTEPWLSWLSLGGLALVSSEIPRPCWRHPSAQNMADFFEFALPASSPVFEPPIESVSRTLFTQNQWTLLKIEKATEVFRYLNDQTS